MLRIQIEEANSIMIQVNNIACNANKQLDRATCAMR